MTWIVIIGLFLLGLGLYAFLAYQESRENERLRESFDAQLNLVLNSIHLMTNDLKARTTPQQTSESEPKNTDHPES